MSKTKDLTGLKFGKLTVTERDRTITKNGKKYNTWKCQCVCGNETIELGIELSRGQVYSCGCSQPDKINVKQNIIGNKYGHLTVLKREEDIVYSDGKKYPSYLCECDCGNKCIKKATYIKSHSEVACDQCTNQKIAKKNYKYNEFVINKDCCEVKCSNSDLTFKIDIEDKEKVSKNCWYIHQSDKCESLYYVYGKDKTSRNPLKLHRFILGCNDDSFVIDHKNHNGLDNRKSNLSVCFTNENTWNQKSKGNIPYKNITFDKLRNKYVVAFHRYKVCVYRKCCDTIEEAIIVRDKIEKIINMAYASTQTICIDIDNIICNTTQCVIDKINNIYGTSYTISDIKEYSIESLLPDDKKHIVAEIFEDKTMWKNIELIPHVVEVVRNLYDRGYKILFATATTSTNFNPKIRFLKRNFPFIDCEKNTICVKNKQILNCDYLIDDSPQQLINGNYKGIALKYPWNENIDGFEKCDTWWDVYKIILTDHQKIHNAQFIKDYISKSLMKENEGE